MKFCVIGGAGFIGTHVVHKLWTLGHEVLVVDCLDPQVHGNSKPDGSIYVQTAGNCRGAASDLDAVIHLGARVGVGQSMYEIERYVLQNTMDTARFLQNLSANPPKRLVVASSMSIYGEGASLEDFETGELLACPTPEHFPPDLRSIYALTKYDQEQLCLIWGKAYDVPTVALRFFNTYGPGQSLTNPYTGVMAIFATRLLNNKPPIIYEDGLQSRDFIHVDDVANAVVHAALNDIPSGAYNVGTGVATTIEDVVMKMAWHLKKGIQPVITRQRRKGDIRHCFADIRKILNTGWYPKVTFDNGLKEYCEWLLKQPIPEDKFDQAQQELVEKGLTK